LRKARRRKLHAVKTVIIQSASDALTVSHPDAVALLIQDAANAA
jgi:hypothetical protein